MDDQGLVDLERAGWQALSVGGSAAQDFFDRILDADPVMALPGGLLINDRSAVLESMGGPPWSSFELSSFTVLRPAPDVGVVVYEAHARRGEAPPYSALTSSTYARRSAGWKLVFHQQTPH